jgi:chromosome segregation ATPase
MTGNITPETDALVPQFLNGGKVPDIFAHCRKLEQERDEAREKYDLEAVEHMLAINKICNERDEAIEKHRFAVIHWQIDVSKMQRERDDALNQIQGWENKWKVAVDMAAKAEIKCDDFQEEIANLQDQRDLAMKAIKRLEANQP